jgi:hypothetical protein
MRYKDISEMPEHLRKQVIKGKAKALTYPLEFSLPIELESLNKFSGPKAAFKRDALKKSYLSTLQYLGWGNIATPDQRQRVTFTRVIPEGGKAFDTMANLGGGSLKQLEDAMTQCGFWHDDSDKWIEAIPTQDKDERPENGYTRIRLELI